MEQTPHSEDKLSRLDKNTVPTRYCPQETYLRFKKPKVSKEKDNTLQTATLGELESEIIVSGKTC